jgi:hypothetical protein
MYAIDPAIAIHHGSNMTASEGPYCRAFRSSTFVSSSPERPTVGRLEPGDHLRTEPVPVLAGAYVVAWHAKPAERVPMSLRLTVMLGPQDASPGAGTALALVSQVVDVAPNGANDWLSVEVPSPGSLWFELSEEGADGEPSPPVLIRRLLLKLRAVD